MCRSGDDLLLMYCICQACSTDSQGGRPSRGRVPGQSFTREINTKVNTESRVSFIFVHLYTYSIPEAGKKTLNINLKGDRHYQIGGCLYFVFDELTRLPYYRPLL